MDNDLPSMNPFAMIVIDDNMGLSLVIRAPESSSTFAYIASMQMARPGYYRCANDPPPIGEIIRACANDPHYAKGIFPLEFAAILNRRAINFRKSANSVDRHLSKDYSSKRFSTCDFLLKACVRICLLESIRLSDQSEECHWIESKESTDAT